MKLICITMMLIGMDVLTGTLAAGMNGTLSSKVARQGLMHKSAYLMCIALATILDQAQTIIDLGLGLNLQDLSCYYICLCEVLSIVENIAKINPELRGTPLLKIFAGTNHDKLTETEGTEK